MRFLRRSLVGLFLLSATLALLVMAGYSLYSAAQVRMSAPERPRMAQERVFTVNVVTAEPGRIAPVLTTFGEVRSRRTLELRAPIAGRIVGKMQGMQTKFWLNGRCRRPCPKGAAAPADRQHRIKAEGNRVADHARSHKRNHLFTRKS